MTDISRSARLSRTWTRVSTSRPTLPASRRKKNGREQPSMMTVQAMFSGTPTSILICVQRVLSNRRTRGMNSSIRKIGTNGSIRPRQSPEACSMTSRETVASSHLWTLLFRIRCVKSRKPALPKHSHIVQSMMVDPSCGTASPVSGNHYRSMIS